MKWVEIQPFIRRIYGCSFLPHHDYGRGGRGWRDLWQDCLALLLVEPKEVRQLLLNNYGGVRFDGSNATIIGSKPGEFIADRNNIARTWMDHGAWPYYTTRLYVDLSGDLNFLLEKQVYFKDKQCSRSRKIDSEWTEAYGSNQKDAAGNVYKGTILEHILLEQITAFYNVGEHNNIRLEGADWNDGFDMGSMGRCFGFAFGHKENGAMFSHMTVMYINALYKRGFAKEGYEILSTMYKHCVNFGKSRILPGIPEYINDKGRGMYNYLTGSASWLLITMLNEVYGVKGMLGDLILEPKLVKEQFDKNCSTKVFSKFRNKSLSIEYKNKNDLQYGEYKIGRVTLDDKNLELDLPKNSFVINKEIIDSLEDDIEHKLIVELV